jgi:xylulokinase
MPAGAKGIWQLAHVVPDRVIWLGLIMSGGLCLAWLQAPEIVQAVMEGVTFTIRQCLELFRSLGGDIREVRLSEGGARVARWCQVIADVLGRPVSLIDELDTSALGAAIMAKAGLSGQPLVDIASNTVRRGDRFVPTKESFAAYELAYGRYQTLAKAALEG